MTLRTAQGETLELDASRFVGEKSQPVNIGIRANHLEIVDSDAGEFVMEVANAEQLGGETYLYGSIGEQTPFTIHLPGQVNIQRGEKIGVALRKNETQLFDTDNGESLRASR